MTNNTPTPESPTPADNGATAATAALDGAATATATDTLPPAAPAPTATVPTYPSYQAPQQPAAPAAPQSVPPVQPAQLYPPQPKTNILGIITLVLGILGFGVVPVITGHIALSQIKKTGEDGRGLTLAGLILGYVTVAGWLLVAFFWVAIAGFAFIGAAANSF